MAPNIHLKEVRQTACLACVAARSPFACALRATLLDPNQFDPEIGFCAKGVRKLYAPEISECVLAQLDRLYLIQLSMYQCVCVARGK